MKLPPSGGLNLSVLDGWWCEAYAQNRKSGWVIGGEIPESTEPIDPKFEDEVDISSLFHVLEAQIIPLYYAKPDGRLPLAWIQLMRESIRTVVPAFTTHRMVKEYTERLYEPAAKAYAELAAHGGKKAAELSKWKESIRKAWPQIRVSDVKVGASAHVMVGESLDISAVVHLGPVDPAFVRVQAYVGEAVNNNIRKPTTVDLVKAKKVEEGAYLFHGSLNATDSGTYGLNLRVIPMHPHLTQEHELRLITWAR
jgi:starch phosphorylase